MTPAGRTIIAQLSDPHIRAPGRLTYRKVDTAAYLRTAVAMLAAMPTPIDAVMVTGDLTDFGTDEEYAHFRALMAPLTMPVYPIPGNHDDRAGMRRAFGARLAFQPDGPLSYVAEAGDLRLMMLDSSVRGEKHGMLGDATLAWLDRELAAQPTRPTVVALHHPPFVTGIRHMDVQNCFDAKSLAQVLARHPQVLLTVCGHVHRTVMTTFAGRPCVIGPCPAHAVAFDLDPAGPPAFRMEPPAFLLHVWTAGDPGRVVTHIIPVGAFDGPYPFFDAQGRLID
jgi:3',5'-cyclic-AMP phosphodiesterase